MTEMIQLMWLPLVACIVIVGLHTYMGLHVLRREVIFVDLALAQIAALGATVAFLFHIHPGTPLSYVFSLAFILLAALIFTFTRSPDPVTPHEAIIGIVYAVATAAAILVADRSPHGAEHIKEMLTGSVLWVTPAAVIRVAAVYLGLGIFHALFRRQFAAVSGDVALAREQGVCVPLWDFLFYLSVGIMVSLSVNIVGVLLVFCFLIVPAVIGMLFASSTKDQLPIAWSVGVAASLLGMMFSWGFDFPTGPSIACFLGAALIAAACLRRGWSVVEGKSPAPLSRPFKAVSVAVVAGVAFLIVLLPVLRHRSPTSGEARADEPAAHQHDGDRQTVDARDLAQQLLVAKDDAEVERLTESILAAGDSSVCDILRPAVEKRQPPVRAAATGAILLSFHDPRGAALLVDLLNDDSLETMKHRERALAALQKISGSDFGYDVLGTEDDNAGPLARWQSFAKALRWGAEAHRFRWKDD